MDPGIYFLMKTKKQKIMIKSTKNSLLMTYFSIHPLISKPENLNMTGFKVRDPLNGHRGV